MPSWKPDYNLFRPTLSRKRREEDLAYVTLLSPSGSDGRDAVGVVDVDPDSSSYGRIVGRVSMPHSGNELHHLSWIGGGTGTNGARPQPRRRYLLAPGIHSSRIHVVDVGQNPLKPKLIKVIEGDEVRARTGYSWPKSVHEGPDGIYINALGSEIGEGPGGIFVLDRDSFEIKGPWERVRGPQYFACDFSWHPGYDTIVTSEWGTPGMVGQGLRPELLRKGKYGNALHVWHGRGRHHVARLDLGPQYQMTLKLRPAHSPARAFGFAAVALCLEDLSASVWLWHREGRNGTSSWKIRKVIVVRAERADHAILPPLLKDYGVVPPLVTNLGLSPDDRFLYVSCWGTGELRQYDVSDPFEPVLREVVRMGGIASRTPHPAEPEVQRSGGPNALEVSPDGRRVYVTNSLYTPWDEQFYPQGVSGWMARLDTDASGGMSLDPRFLLDTGTEQRPRHIRLGEGRATAGSRSR